MVRGAVRRTDVCILLVISKRGIRDHEDVLRTVRKQELYASCKPFSWINEGKILSLYSRERLRLGLVCLGMSSPRGLRSIGRTWLPPGVCRVHGGTAVTFYIYMPVRVSSGSCNYLPTCTVLDLHGFHLGFW